MSMELPALKSLGDLADVKPVVVVDNREKMPLPIRRLQTVRGTLQTGDYSAQGAEHLISIERKSLPDAVQSCIHERARFEAELHRLRGFHFARLLIIGRRDDLVAGRYRSKVNPKSILNSLHAFEARYNVPAVWADTPAAGASLVECWVFWYVREVVQRTNELLRAHKKAQSGQ